MRTPLRALSLSALLATAALADDAPPRRAFPAPNHAEVVAKQARLRSVVAELSARDVSTARKEWQAARARSLALLSDYAERADFTIHHELWPRELPLFIDERGTRCALAAVLDGSGEGEAVLRLARDCNDAYLNEIDDDPEVARLLERLGLTMDEAAYIQGPGAARDLIGMTPSSTETAIERLEANSSSASDPSGPGAPGTPGVAPPGRGVTGPGAARGGATGGATGARRRDRDAESLTVESWWSLHRDRYLDVRQLYRGDSIATPTLVTGAWRVTDEERAELRAQLLAAAAADRDARATALAMAGRVSGGRDAAPLIDATLAFLADPNQPEREWAPVLFAILAAPEAAPLLSEIVADTPAGRARFGSSAAIPDGQRAAFAIALGRSGRGSATLAAVLHEAPAAHVELAAACVVALGLAARDPGESVAATTALLAALEEPELPATVLAQVPAALVLANATAALPKLCDIVERFRGPRELRAACADALGELLPEWDVRVGEALRALATRDVDIAARQSAILALGTLSERFGAKLSGDAAAKLAAFQLDGVNGRTRKAEDLPWHCLAAGLAARGQLPGHELSVERLRKLAADDGSLATRAAALLALGLARDSASLPLVIAAAEGVEPRTTSAAMHALGLLGARDQREELLARCIETADPWIGAAAGDALGCLSDAKVVAPLCAALRATRSEPVRGALAQTLGAIGDRRALPLLSSLAFDASEPESTRERAMAALGKAAEPGDVAWNQPLRYALHPSLATPTLEFFASLF